MRISLYAQISLKDRPPDFRGMTGESVNIGKDEPVDFDVMVVNILGRLAEYYGIFTPADVLNSQLDQIAEFCQHARFKGEKDR